MPIVISTPFQPGTYDRLLATCGGSPNRVFSEIGLEITKRFFSQQKIIPPSDAYISSLWEGIWLTATAEGIPQPLASVLLLK